MQKPTVQHKQTWDRCCIDTRNRNHLTSACCTSEQCYMTIHNRIPLSLDWMSVYLLWSMRLNFTPTHRNTYREADTWASKWALKITSSKCAACLYRQTVLLIQRVISWYFKSWLTVLQDDRREWTKRLQCLPTNIYIDLTHQEVQGVTISKTLQLRPKGQIWQQKQRRVKSIRDLLSAYGTTKARIIRSNREPERVIASQLPSESEV